MMLQALELSSKCIPFTESDDVTFDEPWEARAFALVLQLSRSGCFSWSEWVEYFSREVRRAATLEAAGEVAPRYYDQWLAALEKIVVDKSIASTGQLFAKQFSTNRAIQSSGILPTTRTAGGK